MNISDQQVENETSVKNLVIYYNELIVRALVFANIGIIVNVFVILISLKKVIVKQEYKVFVINQAIAYVAFCLFMGPGWFLNAVVVKYSIACKLYGYLYGLSIFMMLYSFPLLPFSRYMKLFKPILFAQYFTKRGCKVMCLIVFLMSLSVTAVIALADLGGVNSAKRCFFISVNSPKGVLYVIALVYFVFVSVLACILFWIFSWKAYQAIRVYQSNQRLSTSESSNGTSALREGSMAETRQVLYISLFQALSMTLAALPNIAFVVMKGLGFVIWSPWLQIGNNLYGLNPFVSGFLVLYLLKPYKNAMKVWLAGIRHGKFQFVQPNEATVQFVEIDSVVHF